MPPEERFWKLVDIHGPVGPLGQCMEWQGKINDGRYGMFSAGSRSDGSRKQLYAHRLAYEWIVGCIPPKYQIDHLCRNTKCVWVGHLEAVSPRENTMRGNTITAANAAKTECPSGHSYSPENTVVSKAGRRVCRECRRIGSAVQNEKRKAARSKHYVA